MKNRSAKLEPYLIHALGPEKVITEKDALGRAMENTLGVERKIRCIVRPGSTREVSQVVDAANIFGVPVYPVSRGRNTGYGDRLPVGDNQILADLSGMKRIRSFDNELGTIVLEPGVTQAQLYEYLLANQSGFWMDVTGAGLDSSIVGNTLDGGFGHTPAGFRRGTMSDLEVVCGNGEIIRTGDLIDFGPNISGLFVQSNFGVVTAMKTRLMRIPACYKSFVVKVPRDQHLEVLIDTLRVLRQKGTLTSLVHIANATRSLMTAHPFPVEFTDRRISCKQAMSVLNRGMLKVGYWTAVGGLYGSREEIRAKEKQVRRAMRGIGSFTSFSSRKIDRLRFLARFKQELRVGLDSLGYVHGLGKGIPNDKQGRNILWRVTDVRDMGLKWVSPKMAAKGKRVRQMLDAASRVFRDHGFDFPVTLTLVLPDHVIGVLNIGFNKNNPGQTRQAETLYRDLGDALSDKGISPYRLGVTDMGDLTPRDRGKQKVLGMLKQVFDPNHIIAPGRYGL